MARLHSRRRPIPSKIDPIEWKKCLGFAPDHVITKTLSATTQLVPAVEAKTREIMRDHFQTRLPELKVRRVNDTCYVDTFFVHSVGARLHVLEPFLLPANGFGHCVFNAATIPESYYVAPDGCRLRRSDDFEVGQRARV
jgi:hypothetical protein